MVTNRPDMLVRSSTDEPVAVIEIKNRPDLAQPIAQEIRRNLLNHLRWKRTPYFLLLSQDRGYIWTPESASSIDATPSREFSMRTVVDRYLPSDRPDRRLRERELEFVVLRWISDLMLGYADIAGEPERALADTGFIAAITDGYVSAEPAA